jgi:hypothetical protein
MKWYDKNPPLYVWDGDEWYNERDELTYQADIRWRLWQCEDKIINFPPKTKVMTKNEAT